MDQRFTEKKLLNNSTSVIINSYKYTMMHRQMENNSLERINTENQMMKCIDKSVCIQVFKYLTPPCDCVCSTWRPSRPARWTCRSSSPTAAERLCWRRRDASVSWRTNTACSPIKSATSTTRSAWTETNVPHSETPPLCTV